MSERSGQWRRADEHERSDLPELTMLHLRITMPPGFELCIPDGATPDVTFIGWCEVRTDGPDGRITFEVKP